ncbi:alpha/beta fold hydrolase [Streptomyces afghaniensis]|uniref:alpha/beta fold hydrolase n=1 Tax=Streptomyces afghaniensis TaxID=66865 RepID=UPI0033B12387
MHGWGGDGREWSPHAEALAGDFQVIVPDLRGHGRSEVPDEGNTPAEMADDLAALLDTLDPGPVTAVGHSMGGQVVNLLAVRHPRLVRAVGALDPAHGAHVSEVEEIRPGSRTTARTAHVPRRPSSPPPSAPPHRPGCARHTCAPCSAPPATSSPSPTPACTPTRARSASARTARRTCAAVHSPRSRSGPPRRRQPGSAAP